MSDSLQFERAEYSASEAAPRVVCASCNNEVIQSYYELGGAILCANCREARERAFDGWGGGRFLRALLAGVVVGAVGAAVWWGIRVGTGYEVGLISIAIGYGVGKAVSWGSHGKGGWLYQLLALFLTYTAIVTNYVPDIAASMTDPSLPKAVVYAIAFIVSYAAPVLMGFENIIGMLIIAFGLFEAWKLNKRNDAVITGPYTVTPAATPAPVANV